MNLKPLCLAAAIAIAGCGDGGGGDSSSGGGGSSNAALSGLVSKGPVAGATLNIFQMDAAGQATGAAVAGPITTAADGSWSVSIPSSVPRPLLVVATGGTYTDEATGGTVTAGEMNSLLPTGADTVAVTPVSELLVRSTRKHLGDNPTASLDDALSAGREKLNSVLGVSFDPLSAVPSTASGASDDALQYAAILGGLSELANSNAPAADPFAAVMALAEDGSDGTLDGLVDGAGAVAIDGGGSLAAINDGDLVSAIGDFATDPVYAGVSAFTVTSSAGAGGAITPASVSVLNGGTVKFTLAPDASHDIEAVTGCGGSLSGNVYTANDIAATCSVSATFALKQYSVNVVNIEGGVIAPGGDDFDHGSIAEFTVMPAVGWAVDSVSGCGGSLSGNTYTTAAITSACTITPVYSRIEYVLSTDVTDGSGTLNPVSSNVLHGDTADITVTPGLGYVLDSVDASCGEGTLSPVGNGFTFTTPAITEACTVSAAFSLQSFTVSTSVSGSGSASPTSVTALYGSTPAFTLTPDANNELVSASGCGGSLSGDTFTTAAITGDCTVNATFSAITHLVTTTAPNGSFTPANPEVFQGSAQVFTVTADEGYSLTGVTGCGGNLSGDTYTTDTITAACEVVATFDLLQYEVTSSAGANGSISPPTQQVDHGSTASFTVTPDSGYEIASVTGCGGLTANDATTYTTTNPVTGACAVTATFVVEGGGSPNAVWNNFNWDEANWQ